MFDEGRTASRHFAVQPLRQPFGLHLGGQDKCDIAWREFSRTRGRPLAGDVLPSVYDRFLDLLSGRLAGVAHD
jgi:hypothetical protein